MRPSHLSGTPKLSGVAHASMTGIELKAETLDNGQTQTFKELRVRNQARPLAFKKETYGKMHHLHLVPCLMNHR
jgi:hypothetical protein